MRRVPLHVPGIVVACVVAVSAFAAAPAFGTHVQCGDVITQDTTLDSDLVDCPGDGVVIGASGIALDLAGHTIDGLGPGTPTVGVKNLDGHDAVSVTNGTIQEFNRGVAYDNNATGGVISRLEIDQVGTALHLLFTDDVLIEQNSTRGAIEVVGDADRNVIRRNDVTGPSGIIVSSSLGPPVPLDSEDNVVEQNRLVDNQFAIFDVGTIRSVITDNRVVRSTEEGIRTTGGSIAALIERNTVIDGGIGIRLATTQNANVVKNHVTGNALDGILLDGAFDTGAVLDHNFTSNNGDDGVDIDRSGVTIRSTVANQNGDLGIEAVSGTIDGGGNKASGNGNPAQCVGVSCK
jgi:nitrous oxidase accessory protein NosD